MTLTGALSARPQETEEGAPSDASITIDAALAEDESSDQRSTLSGFGWASHAPHGIFTSNPVPWNFLHLSAETLRECSSAEGRQSSAGDDEESRRGKGGNKKVLRAVSCTQAVLKDGQKKIVSDLFNLQQALWHKVAWLKERVEEVLEELSHPKGVTQQDLLDTISSSNEDVIQELSEVQRSIEKFKEEVNTDTSALKGGLRTMHQKLLDVLEDISMLKGVLTWLQKTVESIKDDFEKETEKLSNGQSDIMGRIESLTASMNARFDHIGITDSDIEKTLGELRSTLGMIKTDQSMIKYNFDRTIPTIMEDIKKLLTKKDVAIDKLGKNRDLLSKIEKDLKRNLAELNDDLTRTKDTVLQEIEGLKIEQKQIIMKVNDIPTLVSDVGMIKQGQGNLLLLGPAIETNGMTIANVLEKLSGLEEKFMAFTSAEGGFGTKLMDILSAVEKLDGCCGSGVPPKCGENEVQNGGVCLGCPQGYTVHTDSRCYIFKEERKTFNEARRQCTGKGANLATMTPENRDFIFESAGTQLSRDGVWIGLRKKAGSSEWMWEDGSPFTGLNLFKGTTGNQDDCGAASREKSGDSWIDMPCKSRKSFVCQKDAEKVNKRR